MSSGAELMGISWRGGPYAPPERQANCVIFVRSRLRNAHLLCPMRELHGSKSDVGIIVVTQGSIFALCRRSIRLRGAQVQERTMMTQPIQMFENLTSETSAGGNDLTKLGFSFHDRRLIESRPR